MVREQFVFFGSVSDLLKKLRKIRETSLFFQVSPFKVQKNPAVIKIIVSLNTLEDVKSFRTHFLD